MLRFYGDLLPRRGLCFDVGANVGNRVRILRRLGCPVVAVEPQSRCFAALAAEFGRDPGVVLRRQALGRAPGRATLAISANDVLSTLSAEFREATTRSGRFADERWDRTEEVEVTTLDALIAQHGVPDFVKIDVEGFELDVVSGLGQPVALAALEWTPELTDRTIACVEHLARLGMSEFNLSWMESMRLARNTWMGPVEFKALLTGFRDETYLFADVYARPPAP